MSATMTIEMQDLAQSELGLIVRSFGISGWSYGKSRNGEAEAVANAVGRESVAQAGTRSNTWPINRRRGPRREPGSKEQTHGAGNGFVRPWEGRANNLHTPGGRGLERKQRHHLSPQNEKENMSNKPKEKTQARKAAKALGVRFTDEEIAAMSEEIGMAPGEIPDATVVGTFVRRKLRDGRKAR